MGLPQDGAVILFDGVCALCNGFVDFVLARDRGARFGFAALQGETGTAVRAWAKQRGRAEVSMGPERPIAAGSSEADALRSILLWDRGAVYEKSEAALRVLEGLGGAWILLRPLRWIPRFLRDFVYDFIARNRYRWFGKHATCRMPTPAERGRFLP